MIQRGDGARLTLEPFAEVFLGDFDRHFAAEPWIERLVDTPHAAGTDLAADGVQTQAIARLITPLGRRALRRGHVY